MENENIQYNIIENIKKIKIKYKKILKY